MASKAIKRRPISAETDTTGEKQMDTALSDPVTEPLLGNTPQEEKSKTYEPITRSGFWDGTAQECLRWTHLLAAFVAQSARNIVLLDSFIIFGQLFMSCHLDVADNDVSLIMMFLETSTYLTFLLKCFGQIVLKEPDFSLAVNVLSEFGYLLARLFGCSSASKSSQNGQTLPVNLSPLQVRWCLQKPYFHLNYYATLWEGSRFIEAWVSYHQDFLLSDALKELWKLAYPNRQLPPLKSDLWKEMGWQNSDPSTDFRAAGFMSLENLIYFARNYPDSFHRLLHKADGKMRTKAGVHFVQLLDDDGVAFDNLFCVAFQVLDSQWLARRASYMEFNEVLKSTRGQLEQELTIGGISRIQDMPSFRMLRR
ncbi:ELMO/CED-12 family protein [Zea mays]|uniref:ELMO/CED-12 family protein n=1 Tax=Zea mays TaxID=4577 RepID=A0A1D6QGX7_MAIZE|nr:ELMO/CED-12 family protein [Zea mays]